MPPRINKRLIRKSENDEERKVKKKKEDDREMKDEDSDSEDIMDFFNEEEDNEVLDIAEVMRLLNLETNRSSTNAGRQFGSINQEFLRRQKIEDQHILKPKFKKKKKKPEH